MTDQWAYDRVRELVDAQTKSGWHEEHMPSGVAHAFARYIAEHEQAPVDPLLIEATELAGYAFDDFSSHDFKSGVVEKDAKVAMCLESLRRGIEIGKGGANA